MQSLTERKEAHLEQLERMHNDYLDERRQMESIRDKLADQVQTLQTGLFEIGKDRDAILKAHEKVSEELRVNASQVIQDTILLHMRRLEEEARQQI